jgi:hypothetical protein
MAAVDLETGIEVRVPGDIIREVVTSVIQQIRGLVGRLAPSELSRSYAGYDPAP